MTYRGTFNIITTPPYASDLYSQLYNERTQPIGDQTRITEDTIIRITEDGKIRLTE